MIGEEGLKSDRWECFFTWPFSVWAKEVKKYDLYYADDTQKVTDAERGRPRGSLLNFIDKIARLGRVLCSVLSSEVPVF